MSRTGKAWIKVIVVDEDPLSCMYFDSILEDAIGIQCARTLSRSEDIADILRLTGPDIILVDVGTPEVPGVTTVRRVRQCNAGVPIMMIASNENDDLLYHALCAGASGYLLRTMSPEEMLVAICEYHAGGAVMNAMIARRALNFFQCCDENTLSESELIVLGLISRGKTIKEIARRMLSSLHAVKRDICRVYEKLSCAAAHRHDRGTYVHAPVVNGVGITKV